MQRRNIHKHEYLIFSFRISHFCLRHTVAAYTKIRAAGICQLCGQPAPFKDKDGEPFLENHHLVWLSRGGTDTIDNTVALCPNCHRKMHILDLQEDIDKLIRIAKELD